MLSIYNLYVISSSNIGIIIDKQYQKDKNLSCKI